MAEMTEMHRSQLQTSWFLREILVGAGAEFSLGEIRNEPLNLEWHTFEIAQQHTFFVCHTHKQRFASAIRAKTHSYKHNTGWQGKQKQFTAEVDIN